MGLCSSKENQDSIDDEHHSMDSDDMEHHDYKEKLKYYFLKSSEHIFDDKHQESLVIQEAGTLLENQSLQQEETHNDIKYETDDVACLKQSDNYNFDRKDPRKQSQVIQRTCTGEINNKRRISFQQGTVKVALHNQILQLKNTLTNRMLQSHSVRINKAFKSYEVCQSSDLNSQYNEWTFEKTQNQTDEQQQSFQDQNIHFVTIKHTLTGKYLCIESVQSKKLVPCCKEKCADEWIVHILKSNPVVIKIQHRQYKTYLCALYTNKTFKGKAVIGLCACSAQGAFWLIQNT